MCTSRNSFGRRPRTFHKGTHLRFVECSIAVELMLPTQLVICVATAALSAVSFGLFFACGVGVAHDLVDVAKSTTNDVPCRYATPSLTKLSVGLGAFGYGPTLFPNDKDTFVQAKSAVCSQHKLDDLIQKLYMDHDLTKNANTTDKIGKLVCKHGRSSSEGEDVTSRTARAYISALPALEILLQRLDTAECDRSKSPLGLKQCPNMNAILQSELENQKTIYFEKLDTTDVWMKDDDINTTAQLTTLFVLGIYSHWDRESNEGRCFSNEKKMETVSQMCGTASPKFEKSRPLLAHQTDRCRGLEKVAAGPDGGTSLCELTHTFGYFDQDALFGIPDASRRANAGKSRVSWFQTSFQIYSLMYKAWFEDRLEESHTAQTAMRVFSAFRIGSSMFWVLPGIFASVFWMAYGGVPAAFYVASAVMRRLQSGKWTTSMLPDTRPSKSNLRLLGLVAVALVVVWTTAIDPYPVVDVPRLSADCDDFTGGHVFGSSDDSRMAALTGAFLVAASAGVGVAFDKVMGFKTKDKPVFDRASRSGFLLWFTALAAVLGEGFSLSSSIESWLHASVYNPGTESVADTSEAVERDVHVLLWTAIGYAVAVSLFSQRWVCANYTRNARLAWASAALSGVWTARVVKASLNGDSIISNYSEGSRALGNAIAWGCEGLASTILVLNSLGVMQWKQSATAPTGDAMNEVAPLFSDVPSGEVGSKNSKFARLRDFASQKGVAFKKYASDRRSALAGIVRPGSGNAQGSSTASFAGNLTTVPEQLPLLRMSLDGC